MLRRTSARERGGWLDALEDGGRGEVAGDVEHEAVDAGVGEGGQVLLIEGGGGA